MEPQRHETIRLQLAADTRSTPELVEILVADPDSEAAYEALSILHARGGAEEFQQGARLARSIEFTERIAGADILGQLGRGARTFLAESVSILIGMLRDASAEVQASAAVALGHRRSPLAVEPLLALVSHEDAEVRFAVVMGLQGHDDPHALQALVRLSRDADRDVRNWATFALSVQTDADTAVIRDALAARADDSDPEVRGEALIGLARRHDPRALGFTERELAGEFHGIWAVQAAGHLADAALSPHLEALLLRLDEDDCRHFATDFADAMAACKPQ